MDTSPHSHGSNYLRRVTGTTRSSRSLFFRSVESPKKKLRWRVPDAAISDLKSGNAVFPYQIELECDSTIPSVAGEENSTKRVLTVRHLEVGDIASVLPMCVTEFGAGEAQLWDFPFDDLSWDNVKEWWDRLTFSRLLQVAIGLKIKRRKDGEDRFNPAKPDDNILCITHNNQVVGLVELSLQPPLAERNPPPFPVPMWIKELICRQKGIQKPDAWVTNLLVDERYRQLGYGKLLMWSVEGLGRKWGCDSIYLHTVADTVSGAVPQSLYQSLKYQPVTDQRSVQKFSWMGPEMLSSGLYIVEGVPLLFLRKQLKLPE